MIHSCERCPTTFQRKGRRVYRYCSPSCASRRPSRVSVGAMQLLAEQGLKAHAIASQLGVNMDHARKLLRQFGLYDLWARRRYRKCTQELCA